MTKLKNTDEKCKCHCHMETHDCYDYSFHQIYCDHCNPEKQGDWEREFRKRFVRQPAHDMILVVADVEPVIDFIRQLEKQTRESVIEDALQYAVETVGKKCAKSDFLYQYLLKQKTKE